MGPVGASVGDMTAVTLYRAVSEAEFHDVIALPDGKILLGGNAVANDGIVAKIDYQKAKDALNSAQIRARHAGQAAELESDNVALELTSKIKQLEQQRMDWQSLNVRRKALADQLAEDNYDLHGVIAEYFCGSEDGPDASPPPPGGESAKAITASACTRFG